MTTTEKVYVLESDLFGQILNVMELNDNYRIKIAMIKYLIDRYELAINATCADNIPKSVIEDDLPF